MSAIETPSNTVFSSRDLEEAIAEGGTVILHKVEPTPDGVALACRHVGPRPRHWYMLFPAITVPLSCLLLGLASSLAPETWPAETAWSQWFELSFAYLAGWFSALGFLKANNRLL